MSPDAIICITNTRVDYLIAEVVVPVRTAQYVSVMGPVVTADIADAAALPTTPASAREARGARPSGRRRRRGAAVLIGALALLAGLVPAAIGPASAAPHVTVTPLYFTVTVGPHNQRCAIVADLYVPSSATSNRPAPAILTTNGFGGSKDDQRGLASYFARLGYVALAYSGLGFGGSSCRISLDSPEYDGRAAAQLVSYLGGVVGSAYLDPARTKRAPQLRAVQKDAVDHSGTRRSDDPRVGMVGGSYGGQVQFAAASVDPRIDAITPMITWNDLRYSLAPNHTNAADGVNTASLGAMKAVWAASFVFLGAVSGIQHVGADPQRISGCPNFEAFVCQALVTGDVTGEPGPAAARQLYASSVASYLDKVRIPTLIVQGENDTLFNLSEGAANYLGLQRRGVPTQMIWYKGGHSQSARFTVGQYNPYTPDRATQYVTGRVVSWLDHYLKGLPTPATPNFAYYRDWIPTTGNAAPAFGTSGQYPLPATTLYLSRNSLVRTVGDVRTGQQQLVTPPAGIPTSSSPMDVTNVALPEVDLPGTAVSWRTPSLTAPLDVVGSPVLRVKVDAPVTVGRPLSQQLVLFTRLVDVAPDGTRTTVGKLVSPARIPDPRTPVSITLSAVAHRFATGHRLELVVSGGSVNFRGGLRPLPVRIDTGSPTQQLTLPVGN